MDTRKQKRIRGLGKIFFIVSILFVLYFLIFSDWYGRSGVMEKYHYNLMPFKEIKRFWEYREQLGLWAVVNLAGNVLIFVPFGFFKPMASRNRRFWETIMDGFLLSLLVEVFQLLSKVGRFDVDDLILNTFGVMIGYLTFFISNVARRAYGTKRQRTRKS